MLGAAGEKRFMFYTEQDPTDQCVVTFDLKRSWETTAVDTRYVYVTIGDASVRLAALSASLAASIAALA